MDETKDVATPIETPVEAPKPTWDGHVKQQVSQLMSTFVPISESGNLGIVYRKTETGRFESGPVYDENLVSGVEIVISLDFSQPIERPIK